MTRHAESHPVIAIFFFCSAAFQDDIWNAEGPGFESEGVPDAGPRDPFWVETPASAGFSSPSLAPALLARVNFIITGPR